jgi:hypothetical protein
MLSGLFAVVAPSALAAHPEDTQNFMPDDTPGGQLGNIVGTFLSDKEDGTDQLAHLTNVSTTDTSEVRWFLCPENRFTGTGNEVTDNDELGGCTAIGTDNSGVQPGEGPGTPTAPETDEAYELFFDIPASLDNDVVDVAALACSNSAAVDVEDDPAVTGDDTNCSSDVENDVTLDDAGQGIQGAQTSAGEITSFCGISPPPDSPDCELEDSTDAGSQPDPDPAVDANFRPLPHGSNIPNDGVTVRATSSIDVIDSFVLLTPGDAETDPGAVLSEDQCEEISSDSDSRTWQCTLTDAQVPDDGEFELSFEENDNQPGTGGNCTDPGTFCKLDGHYVVSQDREAAEAVVSFVRQGSSDGDRDISRDAGCTEPDREDTNPTDSNSHIVGCLFDQFGAQRPANDDVTFESSGVGGFDDFSDDCTELHDHDDDGIDEHCHSTEGDTDEEYDAELFSEDEGDQNILFCLDEEAFDGTETAPGPDHGCADETVTDSLVKHWGAGEANEVTLVFDDGDGDCEGDTFRENRQGETDTLIACVFDSAGNAVNTNAEGANGQLQWFITPGADDQTDTRFSETPPQETEEGNEADVGLEAVDRGTDIITVELQDDDGEDVDDDSVEKQVERRRRARSTVSIRHRGRPHRFVGRVTSPRDSCEPGRRVRVRRVRPGRDPVIGSDTTNANGRYRVNHNRTRRRFRYYAQVRGNADCRGDRSGNTRRVR